MAKNPRQRICTGFFIAKCLLSIILGSAALGINGYKVWDLYNQQQLILAQRLKPVEIDPTKCQFNSQFARLEPPEETIMMGFHLDWVTQIPTQMRSVVGFWPAVRYTVSPFNISIAMLTWYLTQQKVLLHSTFPCLNGMLRKFNVREGFSP